MDTDKTRSELYHLLGLEGRTPARQTDRRVFGQLFAKQRRHHTRQRTRWCVHPTLSCASPYVRSVHDVDPVVPRQITRVQVFIEADLQMSGSDRPHEYQNVRTHILQLLSV